MTVTCPACYGLSNATGDDLCTVCYGSRERDYSNDDVIRLTYEKILFIQRKIIEKWGPR